MRPLVFSAALLAWTGCAQFGGRDGEATAEPRPISSPAWTQAADVAFPVEMANGVLMLGAKASVTALDSGSGKVLWQDGDGALAFSIQPETIAYGDPAGSVILRKKDGKLIWKRTGVCSSERFAGFTAIAYHQGSVLAGCGGGKMVRLDGATGAVQAQNATFAVAQISRFQSLGTCAYGVSGWSGGAALVTSVVIVDCEHLTPIMGSQNDVTILGIAGDEAVIDDWCCFGRPDVYRPATIFRKNLKTGDLSPAVELAPQPERYPARSRPIGQNALAFLAGTDVLLSVDTALYDYGPADALAATPAVVADGLSARPLALPGGRMLLQRAAKNGTVTFTVVRAELGKLEPERSWTASSGLITSYRAENGGQGFFETLFPDTTRYMRVIDGAKLYTPKTCAFAAGDSQTIVKRCHSSMGDRLEAYRWPASSSSSQASK